MHVTGGVHLKSPLVEILENQKRFVYPVIDYSKRDSKFVSMEYVDLESGFALIGFAEYREYKRVKQLCVERCKPVAFGGELSKVKEIQARHWVRKVSAGYMDYHHAY
jgi:hypothetical protein